MGMPFRIYAASFTEAPQEAIDAGCKVYNGDIKNNKETFLIVLISTQQDIKLTVWYCKIHLRT